ncbi:hypothetical protein VTL71DRAFT_1709 [Oculimacula yallundae]|uniref:Zn(2)-C6 fungal-type domain-containing protein n=1 Tax=Oculimacula yallundae TaxID=86028 RepID=A0ABR4CBY5_9HELO
MAKKSSQLPSKLTMQQNGQHPLPIQAYRTEPHRHSLSSEEGRLVKKPRASMPKVKSGCVTCKARRVKCDETKPQCLRCQKFGRDCDGYAPEPAQTRGLIQLQPRIPSGPSVAIHTTENEHRYFQMFVNHTAHELSGFYDPTFWTKLVLQESHTIPAVRHSVIALGALNKSLESAPGPDLKVNDLQKIDMKHQEQAVMAHSRAIQSLNHYINSTDSPQLRNALIACLLFVCFETFQGSYATSVQQIYGGLKILRNYYNAKPGSRPWVPRKGAPDASKFRPGNVNKISNAVQTREGCDSVSKDRQMAQHVEDYLENGNHPEIPDDEPDSGQSNQGNAFEDHPLLIRHMGGTESSQSQRNRSSAMPSPMNRQFNESTMSSQNPSPEPSTYCNLRQSPVSGMSNPTTPNTYTPPSTAPHTPSAYNAASTQALTASQSALPSRKRRLASQSPTPVPLLQNDLTIEEVLIQSFVRLDGSGLFFGMVPGIPPLIWDTHQIWHLPIPTTPFTDFPTAQRCWDFLMDRTLQFYRRTLFNRNYAPSTSDPPHVITKQYTKYLKQLSLFEKAFAPLLASAIDPSTGVVLNAGALILSLNQKTTLIMLSTVHNSSEMVYDAFTEDFAYIVRTCQTIVASQDAIHLPRNTRFSFDTGIVPPLHVTASKCRDPTIRRAAIALLFASPRQEGMWDGVLSARIGRWLASCEEEGLPAPPLPSSTSGSPESSCELSSNNSSPSPRMVEDTLSAGGWQDGRRIEEVVNEVHAGEYGAEAYGPGVQHPVVEENGIPTRKKSTAKTSKPTGWSVPEESRMQLTVVDFHMPERHIKVKCQRAVPGRDGRREERMTVIGW